MLVGQMDLTTAGRGAGTMATTTMMGRRAGTVDGCGSILVRRKWAARLKSAEITGGEDGAFNRGEAGGRDDDDDGDGTGWDEGGREEDGEAGRRDVDGCGVAAMRVVAAARPPPHHP